MRSLRNMAVVCPARKKYLLSPGYKVKHDVFSTQLISETCTAEAELNIFYCCHYRRNCMVILFRFLFFLVLGGSPDAHLC